MKQTVISQEILLLTSTTLSNNQFCEINTHTDSTSVSPSEQLEKACWNGMLYEMLPGILNPAQKLFLWQIKNEDSYLKISLGVCIPDIKNRFSLDPQNFLCERIMN